MGGEREKKKPTFLTVSVTGCRWDSGRQMIKSASLPGWIVPSASTCVVSWRGRGHGKREENALCGYMPYNLAALVEMSSTNLVREILPLQTPSLQRSGGARFDAREAVRDVAEVAQGVLSGVLGQTQLWRRLERSAGGCFGRKEGICTCFPWGSSQFVGAWSDEITVNVPFETPSQMRSLSCGSFLNGGAQHALAPTHPHKSKAKPSASVPRTPSKTQAHLQTPSPSSRSHPTANSAGTSRHRRSSPSSARPEWSSWPRAPRRARTARGSP